MHCKHCGALMDEQQTICPECGANQTEEVQTAAPLQAETVFEEPLAEEVCDTKAASTPKKPRLGLIALILAAATLLGAAAVLFLNRDKEPYAGPMDSDQYIVAECNGKQLTNQMFMYYYWGQFYQLYSQYGNTLTYMGLDLNKPFEKQKFDDKRTWADFFTEYALMQWTRDVSITEAIAKEGFTLADSQKKDLETLLKQLDTDAAKNGYQNGEDYLKHAFDLSADVASYTAYTTTSYTNTQYLNSKYNGFLKEGAADPGDHKDIYYIDIRHVLIKFADSSDASKAAAKDKAQKLYDEFKKNPTMDNFAELAKKNSADGSASKGGLIEAVYPGQMVENFDKWCFAEGRKAGDHGLIESEYGWHLMYFDGLNENVYMTAAESYAKEKYSAWEEVLFKNFSLTEYRDKITFRHAEK